MLEPFNVLRMQCVEERVDRKCVKTVQVENIKDASDTMFDNGLNEGNNKIVSNCLAWEKDPLETAQFVFVNVKQNY